MIDQIRPGQLTAWLHSCQAAASDSAPSQPVVLDVREPAELRVASVRPDGFVLIAIPMNEIPARLAELNPNTPVACLCHHGIRSNQVARFLAAQNFGHVVNIAGGIEAWSDEVDTSLPRY